MIWKNELWKRTGQAQARISPPHCCRQIARTQTHCFSNSLIFIFSSHGSHPLILGGIGLTSIWCSICWGKQDQQSRRTDRSNPLRVLSKICRNRRQCPQCYCCRRHLHTATPTRLGQIWWGIILTPLQGKVTADGTSANPSTAVASKLAPPLNKLAKHNHCNSAQCRSAFGLLSSKVKKNSASPAPLHQANSLQPS